MTSLAIKLLPFLVAQLLKMLTPDLIKRFADKILDAVEDAIQKSENKFDDAFLPVIAVIRSAFNVPDHASERPVARSNLDSQDDPVE